MAHRPKSYLKKQKCTGIQKDRNTSTIKTYDHKTMAITFEIEIHNNSMSFFHIRDHLFSRHCEGREVHKKGYANNAGFTAYCFKICMQSAVAKQCVNTKRVCNSTVYVK